MSTLKQNAVNPDQMERIIDSLYSYDTSQDNSQVNTEDQLQQIKQHSQIYQTFIRKSTLQNHENSDQIGRIIDILQTTMNAPIKLRSDIYISTPQIKADFDFERYRTANYKVDNIIYHLEFQKKKEERGVYIYTFSYQSLVPRSQLKNFEVWVTNDFGAKLIKTKSSITRIEIYLEQITLKQQANNKDNNQSSRKVTANVCLGAVNGKFQERYSNTVIIDLLVKYV